MLDNDELYYAIIYSPLSPLAKLLAYTSPVGTAS